MRPTLNRRFCVAPMMRYTDRHFRYLLRLMSHHAVLYTEMYTARSILENADALLKFHASEHPIAVQLGGNKPAEMAMAAAIAQDYGYDEVNINVGCPSPRVSAGAFGACLMKQPVQVADCVTSMKKNLSIPVSIKCRIGVDDTDSYDDFKAFVEIIAQSGSSIFIIHARKAWLQGVSPKANRRLPKLCYDYVYRLKHEYPELTIVLNGGLESPKTARMHLERGLDGVMLGRAICHHPLLLRDVDRLYYENFQNGTDQRQILQQYVAYMEQQMKLGQSFYPLARHLINFHKQCNGAKYWRRSIAESLRETKHPMHKLKQLINQFNLEENYVMDAV